MKRVNSTHLKKHPASPPKLNTTHTGRLQWSLWTVCSRSALTLENEPHEASVTQPIIRIHVCQGWTPGLVAANSLLHGDVPTSFLTYPMADRHLERAQLNPQDLQKRSHWDAPREGG